MANANASDETLTEEQFLNFLSLAPTHILVEAGRSLDTYLYNLPECHKHVKPVSLMLLMLAREYELRQIEPLWRKAQRFAIRNSETFKQVGKIAACIGAGALLGVSLDN